MGISDDIKPNKKIKKTPKVSGEDKNQKEKIELEEGEELVEIRKDNAVPNVFAVSTDHQRVDFSEDFFSHEAENETKEEEEDEKEKKENRTKQKSKFNWLKIIIIVLVLLLVVILVKQNLNEIYDFLGINALVGNSTESSVEENPYESLPTTDYTAGANSQDQAENTSQEAPAAANATPVASLDKSGVRISVLNGNGIKGSAEKVATQIENAGYSVNNTSNAKVFSYEHTIIYYKTGKIDYANDLKSTLNNRVIDLVESSSITGTFDMVVVVGAQ